LPRRRGADKVKACWAGGTAQFYNKQGRDSSGIVPALEYETVRNQIVNVFQNLTDSHPSWKTGGCGYPQERGAMGCRWQRSLHPSRSGDVVVVLRPPYQYDAATPESRIAFSRFFG
jgi:hypothetical protein